MKKIKANIGDVVRLTTYLMRDRENFEIIDISHGDYVLKYLDGSDAFITYSIRLLHALINAGHASVIKRNNGLIRALKRLNKHGKKTKI